MKRLIPVLVLLISATTTFGHEYDSSWETCSSNHFQFGNSRSFTKEEVIDAGQLASLKATVDSSPLSVTGGNPGGYRIVVCKAATSEAELAAIRVTLQNGELKAEGPSGDDWTATFRIRAPHGAKVEIDMDSGPVSVKDFDGSLVVRAANGPLSLKNVEGEVDVTTTNGPISVSGGSGTMKLRATNGPLTIKLDGTGWSGGSLDAETRNGPVTLKLPRGYASGVVVESRGGGPIACKAEGCERAGARLLDDRWSHEPRTIELGSGPAAVRVTTVNGPVSIKEDE